MDSITFVGLGNMGIPMARRLIAAGHDVVGYDPSELARAKATEAGIPLTASLVQAAATTRVLILMLPTSRIVDDVLVADGVLTALPVGATVIDMGSSDPTETRRLAALAGSGNRAFVDAPVSGGVGGAERGALTIMVGGEPVDVEPVLPLLEAMGSQVRRVGPAGAGHALKALNNLMSAAHLLVSSEALLVGEAFGLDFATMLEVINSSSGRSGSTEAKWPKFILPGTFDSGFGMALMAKDMGIAVSLANAVGSPAPLSHAATSLWADAVREMPAGADHTAIVEWLRRRHNHTEEVDVSPAAP